MVSSVLVLALSILGLALPNASGATPRALINADTVAGGTSSAEATIATALGFSVDVVDGPTWSSMTQTQFAQYQVLIAGDPNCGSIAGSFISSEGVWAPVVMGTAVNSQPGNRVLVGTDPVFHSGGTGPRATLISDGIDFAGAQPGRTGLYFDTTCGGNYNGQTGVAASMLGQLSAGTGAWTEDDTPPCGGNVAKIASTPKFDSLTTADIEGWSCSVHESFPTFASDWTPLAVATDTTSHPTCGTDTTVTPPVPACGEAYVLIAGSGIVVVAPNISVTPATGSDPAGGTHAVTANVTVNGSPVSGQLVTFTVTGQNAGAVGTCVPIGCTTDSNGNVTFTYTDTKGVGTDTILAAFSDSSGSTQQASASETWTPKTNQPPVLTPANGTVQYSDPITPFTVSATDAENDPLTLGATGLPAGLTFTDNHNGTGTVSGTATAVPASYTVTYTASDGVNPPSTATGTVTVAKEDCTLSSPATLLSNASGLTTLTTSMGEPDATLGDRSSKAIAFAGLDSSLTPVGPFTATTDANGNAAASVPLGAGVYTIDASFAGDAYYNPCKTTSSTIVTVAPAQFKVTGGGWMSNSVGRTSFGFNAISDVTGLHGQIQVRTNAKGKFHGNTVLTLAGTNHTAQWTGTGSWNGMPGYRYTAAVVDAGTSGKNGDTLSITITNPAGTATVFTTNGAQALKGGNIVVH